MHQLYAVQAGKSMGEKTGLQGGLCQAVLG